MNIDLICLQIRNRNDIDPIRGGPLAKWREALYKQLCAGDALKYCQQFKKDKNINPLTNRVLSKDSKVRVFFEELLKAVNTSPQQSAENKPRNDDENDMASRLEMLNNHYKNLQKDVETHKNHNKKIMDEIFAKIKVNKENYDGLDRRFVQDQIKSTQLLKEHTKKIQDEIKSIYEYIHAYSEYNKKTYQKKILGRSSSDSPRESKNKTENAHRQQEQAKKDAENARAKAEQEFKNKSENTRRQQEQKKQSPRKRREDAAREAANDPIIIQFKAYYIETLKSKLASGKPVDKKFILLNYHPDKLPLELKALIKSSKMAEQYSSRIFSALNSAPTVTMSFLQQILVTELMGGKLK